MLKRLFPLVRPWSRRLVPAAALALGLSFPFSATGQEALRDPTLLREFWSSPQFVERFLGSFGFDGQLEPSITAEERNLLRRVVELIPQNLEEAATFLQRSLRPDSSAAFDFTLANIYFQLGRLDEARRGYETALRKYPNFLRAQKNLGMVQVQRDDLEGALRSLIRAVELGGADGITYGLMGYAHLQRNRTISAQAAYQQALLLDPENSNWKLGLARSFQLQERHREAAALMEELIAQDPARPELWLFQANALLALDEPARAARNLEIVRRLGAATPESLLALADIYINDELVDLALAVYEEALTAAPGRTAGRALRAAEVLAQRGREEEARALLGKVEAREERLEPRDRIRRQRIEARLLLETEPERAAAVLEELLTESPLDGDALLLLARAQARLDEAERALLTLDRARDVPGFAAAAHRQKGELLVAQRRFEEALGHLRQAQAIEPRDFVARYIEQVERLARLERER